MTMSIKIREEARVLAAEHLRRRSTRRVQQYREARAIIAVAAIESWKTPNRKFPQAPNYYNIAKALGLSKKVADLADRIWNDANGPDEGQHTEERAMERVNDLLEVVTDG